jgi:hypothetical protein
LIRTNRQHAHSRFGRGRGNGTGPRTTTTLCTGWVEDWNAAGARKDAIGSSVGGLRTAGDLWMEPVSSSLAASCFPPLLIFRSANMLNTIIIAATILSRGLRLGVSQGIARRFRIGRHPNPRRGVSPLAPTGRETYSAALNKFLGISLWGAKASVSMPLLSVSAGCAQEISELYGTLTKAGAFFCRMCSGLLFAQQGS